MTRRRRPRRHVLTRMPRIAAKQTFRSAPRALALAGALGALMLPAGCLQHPGQRTRATAVQPDSPILDQPPILRGAIDSLATLRGDEYLLVSGYGIVVGLDGTGSGDAPPAVRAYMEREMTTRGVGRETYGMGWTTPSRMLDDRDTAVVVVQAALPPGMPKGATFDVLVSALPGSATTSLEGGRLWATQLRAGPPRVGGADTPAIASASGDLFINPFADPAASGVDAINRRTARILGGGAVTRARELFLVLDAPSHARARSVVAAVNNKFPRRPEDPEKTAIGVNEELIEINVPRRYANRGDEFVPLLMATRADPLFPDEWARRYARELKQSFDLATPLSWRLEALGEVAIPFLRECYTVTDAIPRLAALRAGARLDDPLSAPHLIDMASSGPSNVRVKAIELLGGLPPDPDVNLALRELLDAPEIEIRVAAYEALARRGDPTLERQIISGRFLLDVIPAAEPTIYISQQEQPRIVIFGSGLSLKRPIIASGWSDRLMVAADSPTDRVRLYYLDHRSDAAVTHVVPHEISGFIEFLAHKQTPEQPAPGLDFSYSEVVGALHELWKAGAIECAFIAEQDKLAAELLRSFQDLGAAERPEGGPADVPTQDEALPTLRKDQPRPSDEEEDDRPAGQAGGGGGGGGDVADQLLESSLLNEPRPEERPSGDPLSSPPERSESSEDGGDRPESQPNRR